VRGDGEQVSDISAWIYPNPQDRMNSIDCAGVLSDLNQIVHTRGSAAITTAPVVSHDINEGTLYYAYAGLPPVLARESRRKWLPLVPEAQSGQANLPLGVFRLVRYDQGEVRVQAGDVSCFILMGYRKRWPRIRRRVRRKGPTRITGGRRRLRVGEPKA